MVGITNLKQEKVDGATIMNINGADKLKELLDPIIEKNTLFSKGYCLFNR